MRVALDFAACWHSRVTARFSEYLKELSRDESLTDRAVRTDSGRTRIRADRAVGQRFVPRQFLQILREPGRYARVPARSEIERDAHPSLRQLAQAPPVTCRSFLCSLSSCSHSALNKFPVRHRG